MGLLDHLITSEDITTFGVVAAPDRMTGTAEENKKVFDRLIRDSVKGDFNAIINLLVAATAASELGFQGSEGLDADTIQEAIDIIKGKLDDLTPDYEALIQTVTTLKNAAETAKDTAVSKASEAAGSASNAAGSATAAAGSASAAAGSASAASGYATDSQESATNSAGSATAAAGSASAAADSASDADGSATAAAGSASAAAGSAAAAAESEAEAARVVSEGTVGAVRHDVSQGLSAQQKSTARGNIGAEETGHITIGGTVYQTRKTTTDDGGQSGYITFVVES